MSVFDGDICIRQRVLASYRYPFFDLLAKSCSGDVHVIAGQPKPDEGIATKGTLKQARHVEIPNRYRRSGVLLSYSQPGIVDCLGRLKPNLFVTQPDPRFSDMRAVVNAIHKLGIPAVGLGIGTADFWNQPLKRARAWLRNRRIGLLDGMFCYSSRAAEEYSRVGFPDNRLFVLYNATVSRPTNPEPPARSVATVPSILSIGRLIASKSLDNLIKASAMVAKRGISHRLKIVGDGDQKEFLQELASQLGAPAEFLGRRTGDELNQIGYESDLFVLPGLGGLAIQEAMAMGLPVVVTEADGTEKDLVREGVNGWVVEKENVESLTECLAKALANPTDLRDKGKESYRIVREEINLDLMVERFINASNEMVQLGIR